MNNGFNLPAIWTATLLGLMMLIMLVMCSHWWRKNRVEENRNIMAMVGCVSIACLIDAVMYTLDGRPGELVHWILLIGNSLLFVANGILCLNWVLVNFKHLNMPARIYRHWGLRVPTMLCFAAVALNLFEPFVFDISPDNVYTRDIGYNLFAVVTAVYILAPLVPYFMERRKGGLVRFYPVWAFMLPMALGAYIQNAFYGMPVAWPGLAISLCAMLICLQNEQIFRDQLTGLYNRTYLEHLKKDMMEQGHEQVTGVMLDLNSFKSINDEHGHAMGDDALVAFAALLTIHAAGKGVVVRCSGDEFIVLLKTQEEIKIHAFIREMKAALVDFNKTSGKPYHLEAAMGYSPFDVKNQTADEFMNIIDRSMYTDKAEYYRRHPEKERRRR